MKTTIMAGCIIGFVFWFYLMIMGLKTMIFAPSFQAGKDLMTQAYLCQVLPGLVACFILYVICSQTNRK